MQSTKAEQGTMTSLELSLSVYHKDTSVAATDETRWGSISKTPRVGEIRSGKTEIMKAEPVVCSVDCQRDAIQDHLSMGDLLSRLTWPVDVSVGDCLIQ